MRSIRIYQIKNVAECKYSFMSWDYAQDKCKMDDYEMVAEFEMDEKEYPCLLDILWIKGNNGELQKIYKMRSISVSDIIEIDGAKHYVDRFGFKEVE